MIVGVGLEQSSKICRWSLLISQFLRHAKPKIDDSWKICQQLIPFNNRIYISKTLKIFHLIHSFKKSSTSLSLKGEKSRALHTTNYLDMGISYLGWFDSNDEWQSWLTPHITCYLIKFLISTNHNSLIVKFDTLCNPRTNFAILVSLNHNIYAVVLCWTTVLNSDLSSLAICRNPRERVEKNLHY
jgi:hypothetical protein